MYNANEILKRSGDRDYGDLSTRELLLVRKKDYVRFRSRIVLRTKLSVRKAGKNRVRSSGDDKVCVIGQKDNSILYSIRDIKASSHDRKILRDSSFHAPLSIDAAGVFWRPCDRQFPEFCRCYCLVHTSRAYVPRYCELDDAGNIFRASDKPRPSKRSRCDVSIANPIAEVTDGGESNVRVVIATVSFHRAHADDATKIPNPILLEAQAAAAVSLADARTWQSRLIIFIAFTPTNNSDELADNL